MKKPRFPIQERQSATFHEPGAAANLKMQDRAIALSRVAKVLGRSSHLQRPEKGGRMLMSMGELQSAYAMAYPAANSEELEAGLEELLRIGEIEKRDGHILFDPLRLK